MSKIGYIVMKHGSEYNDEYDELKEGGDPQRIFTGDGAKDKAESEAERMEIELYKGTEATKWNDGFYDFGSYGQKVRVPDIIISLFVEIDGYCAKVRKNLNKGEYRSIYKHMTPHIFYVEEVPIG